MKKLFACDWDYTIVEGHTHNTIIKKKAANPNDPEYINGDWNTVKDIPILGSAAEWKKFFESAIQQDHYVAIVSFNGFKNNIPLFLENINLDKKVIEKIDIIAELPEDPKSANKNEYIQRAIANAKKEGFSGQPENVYLIDDSRKNIEAAQQAGYQVIHAKKDGSHLIELQNKLEELKKLKEKPPVVDRNAKPKQLSESELLKLKIKTLEKQREALAKQREEHQEHLEQTNIYSNNKIILLNDQKLNELDLADKENYDQLSKVKRQLSELQSQGHNDKPATVSKEVIEQSPQRAVDSQTKQLKQEIEKYKNMREKHIETILQLSRKKNLSSEENSTLSSLKSDLPEITAVIQVKEECLGKIEKPDALVVDHDSKPKRFETNSEKQGVVSKVTKQSPQQTSAVPVFLDELKAKQGKSRLTPSSFFSSPSSSSNQDAKEKEKEKISSKGFSYRQ